jgi:hypothetical protein
VGVAVGLFVALLLLHADATIAAQANRARTLDLPICIPFLLPHEERRSSVFGLTD